MPTATIEGPPLPLKKKRQLVPTITDMIGRSYDWTADRLIVIIHEKSNENVARGGVLHSGRQLTKEGG